MSPSMWILKVESPGVAESSGHRPPAIKDKQPCKLGKTNSTGCRIPIGARDTAANERI